MHNEDVKVENTAPAKGARKAVIAAVTVLFVIMAAAICFLIFRNGIFLSLARSSAQSGDFSSASELIAFSDDEAAQPLGEYIRLRNEINEKYPAMMTDFDISIIREWSSAASYLCNEKQALGDEISQTVSQLSAVLDSIITSRDEYVALKNDILSLMDIFNEINRLHIKDAEGKNTPFTIKEEREKIGVWTDLSGELLEFVSSVPGNENMYLINYMAKEAQGELSELSAAIDSVEQGGYSETDAVRFSGDAQKRFPDITNSSGVSVNLLDKVTYEKYMHEEFCTELVKNLAPYFINNG